MRLHLYLCIFFAARLVRVETGLLLTHSEACLGPVLQASTGFVLEFWSPFSWEFTIMTFNYVLLSSDDNSNKSKEAAKSCSVSRMNLELKWEIPAEEQREADVLPSAVRLLHRVFHLPGVPSTWEKRGKTIGWMWFSKKYKRSHVR